MFVNIKYRITFVEQIERIMKTYLSSQAQTTINKLVDNYKEKVKLIDKTINTLLDEIREYRHEGVTPPEHLYNMKKDMNTLRQSYIQFIEDLKTI